MMTCVDKKACIYSVQDISRTNKTMARFFLVCVMWLFTLCPIHVSFAQEWKEVKDKHFVVLYARPQDRTFAQKVARSAEKYYKKIGDLLGYSRYARFWTWDARVRIVLFPDQQSFVQKTGQPLWSRGYADRDSFVFSSRSIVTYKQEQNILDGLLPHEISHLILHDFIQEKKRIPIWFDEGIAQLQEEEKVDQASVLMRALVKRGQYIYLPALHQWDIRQEDDEKKVSIFYAQSLSTIDFMITRYGKAAFARLCRLLRDGYSFEDALHKAYTNSIDSLGDLEDRWVTYMSR